MSQSTYMKKHNNFKLMWDFWRIYVDEKIIKLQKEIRKNENTLIMCTTSLNVEISFEILICKPYSNAIGKRVNRLMLIFYIIYLTKLFSYLLLLKNIKSLNTIIIIYTIIKELFRYSWTNISVLGIDLKVWCKTLISLWKLRISKYVIFNNKGTKYDRPSALFQIFGLTM